LRRRVLLLQRALRPAVPSDADAVDKDCQMENPALCWKPTVERPWWDNVRTRPPLSGGTSPIYSNRRFESHRSTHIGFSVVTERERLDRGALLKRAAALGGAVYVSPVLVESASAARKRCSGQPCKPGPKGDRKCKRKGGTGCQCIGGRCMNPSNCGSVCQPGECGSPPLCGTNCACFPLVPGQGGTARCVDGKDGLCSSFPPCDKRGNGSDCPPGTCCFDFCCAQGSCMAPCGPRTQG
jgi:hypothetical protein